MNVITEPGWLNLILVGLLFGFGFAIGNALWGAIVNVARKARG